MADYKQFPFVSGALETLISAYGWIACPLMSFETRSRRWVDELSFGSWEVLLGYLDTLATICFVLLMATKDMKDNDIYVISSTQMNVWTWRDSE